MKIAALASLRHTKRSQREWRQLRLSSEVGIFASAFAATISVACTRKKGQEDVLDPKLGARRASKSTRRLSWSSTVNVVALWTLYLLELEAHFFSFSSGFSCDSLDCSLDAPC